MLAASTLLVALRIHLATSSADSNPCTLLLCTSTSASLITTDALACPSLFFSILLFYSFFWVSSTSACVRCTASHEASAFFPQCLSFFNLPEAVASNDGDGRLLDQPPAFPARHEPTHQDCHDPVNHKATDTDTRQLLIPLGQPSPWPWFSAKRILDTCCAQVRFDPRGLCDGRNQDTLSPASPRISSAGQSTFPSRVETTSSPNIHCTALPRHLLPVTSRP